MWHPEDMLVVPLRHSDGHLLGILGVDEPAERPHPDDDDSTRWWRSPPTPRWPSRAPRRAAQARRHREALEQLLQVSSRLTETFSIERSSQSVCDGIHTRARLRRTLRSTCPTPTRAGFRSRARRSGWDLDDRR